MYLLIIAVIAVIVVIAGIATMLKTVEGFELPDKYSRNHARLFEIVMNVPLIFKYDVLKIKEITHIDNKSKVLDAGCGVGKHIKFLKELVPNVSVEGVDASQSMLVRARINNPTAELKHISLTESIYKPNSLSHILCLHDTIHHNGAKDTSTILNNFHNWLMPNGFLAVHIFDFNKLDAGPRPFSQYFKADDGTRHALTYFEGMTHEAWWEKQEKHWFSYCEKYSFSKDKVKVCTTKLWIPPIPFMLGYIERHKFKLKEIISLKEVEIAEFQLYIFTKV